MKYIYRIFIFLLIVCWSVQMTGQGIHTEFGQNRVQYKKMEWQQYESEHFITYWTKGGRTLGEYAVSMGEADFMELQNLLKTIR